jgi:hypothetical protein
MFGYFDPKMAQQREHYSQLKTTMPLLYGRRMVQNLSQMDRLAISVLGV